MIQSEILEKLMGLGYERQEGQTNIEYQKMIGAFLGMGKSYIVGLHNNPDVVVRPMVVRIFDFYDRLPEEKQKEARDLWLSDPLISDRKRKPKEREKFAALDKMVKRLEKLGMSTLGIFSLLGTTKSVYLNCKRNNQMKETLAQSVYMLSLFDEVTLFDLAIEYEISPSAMKRLKINKSKLVEKLAKLEEKKES